MQLLAPGSLETKINWAKDVEKFESRLNTGLNQVFGSSRLADSNDGGVEGEVDDGGTAGQTSQGKMRVAARGTATIGNASEGGPSKKTNETSSGSRSYFNAINNYRDRLKVI